MSDQKIAEFRERAELAVDVPDFSGLERRGRGLQRRRQVSVAGGLALALVAGYGLVSTVGDTPDASPAPANPAPTTPNTPGPSWDGGVRKVTDVNGEELLLPGRSTARYGGVEVSFDVPGERWEWSGVGAGLRLGDDPDSYATTVFWLPEPSVRLGDCLTERAEPLGTNSDDLVGNVRPMLDAVSSTVLREPRVVDAFGGRAAYLRLRVDTSCPPGGELPAQFRGVANGETFDPGWEGPHLVDAWHVLAGQDQSFLVVAWHLDETAAQAAEREALVESIRIRAAD